MSPGNTQSVSAEPSLGAADSALLSLGALRAGWCARAWCYPASPRKKSNREHFLLDFVTRART